MVVMKDPVCGMMVDPMRATGSSMYRNVAFYFCSASCKRTFDKDPAKYA